MTRIFISYRRSDSRQITERIHDRVAARFGRTNVFKDVTGLNPGEDFASRIHAEIARCEVALIVIGDNWLTATDPKDPTTLRLADPKDYVRMEVLEALARPIPAIPVLVGEKDLPPVADLPAPIRTLVESLFRFHAVRIRPDPDFDEDIKRLTAAIATRRRRYLKALTALALLLAVAVGVLAWTGLGKQPDPNPPPPGPDKEYTNSLGMRFCRIPAGKFVMGSPEGEALRREDEQQQEIEIPADFFLGTYEVSQQEYLVVASLNPSQYVGAEGRLPVHKVTWGDAVRFCSRLNELDSTRPANYEYRLPTEAEWEYACRSGETGPYHFGATLSGQQAKFRESERHAVGAKEGDEKMVIVPLGRLVRFQAKSKMFPKKILVTREDVFTWRIDPTDPSTILLTGAQPGLCNLELTYNDGAKEVYTVNVQTDFDHLRAILRRTFPSAKIEIVPLGKSGAVLTGSVERAADLPKVLEIVRVQLNCRAEDIVNSIEVSGGPAPVGSYGKNRFDLYDMHGNVAEWCLEWYRVQYSPGNKDPELADAKRPEWWHSVRGGSWDSEADFCRCAARDHSVIGDQGDLIGFRVALVPAK